MIFNQLPNLLSWLRIALTPLFLLSMALALQDNTVAWYGVFVLYGFVALSDFLDGKLARRWNLETRFGQELDIVADVIFIVSSAAFLTVQQRLPLWVIPMIVLKLLEFRITSHVLSAGNQPVFDPMGRVGAVLFYSIPLFAFVFQDSPAWVTWFLIVTLTVTLISSVTRVVICFENLRRRRHADL